MKLIAQCLGNNIVALGTYDKEYGNGDSGEVRLFVDKPLKDTQLAELQERIGATLTDNVRQDAGIVAIRFVKRSSPLLIIAIAVGAVIATVVGWQVFKAITSIPSWAWLAGLSIGGYLLWKRIKW